MAGGVSAAEILNRPRDTGTAIREATEQALGKDDFLKLLLTELRYQDALDPMKDKEFIAQMAQFSSLEQITNLTDAFEKFAAQTAKSDALSILGRRVTAVDTASGETFEGIAEAVAFSEGDPTITLDLGEGKIKTMPFSSIIRAEVADTA